MRFIKLQSDISIHNPLLQHLSLHTILSTNMQLPKMTAYNGKKTSFVTSKEPRQFVHGSIKMYVLLYVAGQQTVANWQSTFKDTSTRCFSPTVQFFSCTITGNGLQHLATVTPYNWTLSVQLSLFAANK